MNLKWLSLMSGIVCSIAIVTILVFTSTEDKFVATTENINLNKKQIFYIKLKNVIIDM